MIKGKTVSAVIVAAGSGQRMGFDKLTAVLSGKSVIARTMLAFVNNRYIDEIILVSSQKNIDFFTKEVKENNIEKCKSIVLGGQNRSESCILGIKAAMGDIVLIHDGARPLVSDQIISSVTEEALEFGAAAVAVPAKDTIKLRDENGFIKENIERENAVLMQTPQAFIRSEIIKAYALSTSDETDDCAVAQKHGIKIKLTYGSYENLKLTTPEDFWVAEEILKNRTTL
ncbi:MAG: 2-C-methyl-D-erythritol 4-phosphate cytidylyltransferase [Clostridia bacterium]|nr:2-C-methyl-D-erythritol 4-phosphate cytidylyltransferase [Clostridia bacterium]